MKYVGLHTQQVRNNTRSVLLLMLFPSIIIALVWTFFFIIGAMGQENYMALDQANEATLQTLPWVVIVVGAWFFVAYMTNTHMIRSATGAHSIERRENPRIYNIVENLTMACGMPMPKINVIDTPELNAFASGVDTASYTVTVTTGICDRLNDDELAGVIAHELTHIRNRDTRLLIVSIVFVGIMSTIMSIAFRLLWNNLLYGNNRRSREDRNGGIALVVGLAIAAVLAAIGYFFTTLTRFAISRKREYMADAGGAALCGNPLALASALRKISSSPMPAPNNRDDIAQLFIVHSAFGSETTDFFRSMFSTHPSIESRIRYLEQF